jgi:hypothetical protein
MSKGKKSVFEIKKTIIKQVKELFVNAHLKQEKQFMHRTIANIFNREVGFH